MPLEEIYMRATEELGASSTILVVCGHDNICDAKWSSEGLDTPCEIAVDLLSQDGRMVAVIAASNKELLDAGVVLRWRDQRLWTSYLNEER